MATTYSTAIGRLRTDVTALQGSVGSAPWKVTPYQVGAASGTPLAITPANLFATSGTPNANEIYFLIDDTAVLTAATKVNIEYAQRPTNSIIVMNGTAQNLELNVLLDTAGAFYTANSNAQLLVKNLNSSTATIIPGEAVTFYITDAPGAGIYYFPGILQLNSSTAINTPEAGV